MDDNMLCAVEIIVVGICLCVALWRGVHIELEGAATQKECKSGEEMED